MKCGRNWSTPGIGTVSLTDAVELQILAERVYRSDLYHADLAVKLEKLHAELATAGFGL